MYCVELRSEKRTVLSTAFTACVAMPWLMGLCVQWWRIVFLTHCLHIRVRRGEMENMRSPFHTCCLLYRLKMNWMRSAPKFSRIWNANCRTPSLTFLSHVWRITYRTTQTYIRFWAASQLCSAILWSMVNIFSFALSNYLYLFCFPCLYFASVMKYGPLCALRGGLQWYVWYSCPWKVANAKGGYDVFVAYCKGILGGVWWVIFWPFKMCYMNLN